MGSRPRYLDALRRHLEENEIEPGELHHVEIRHDDGCAHWEGDACDCDPDVESGTRIRRKYEGTDVARPSGGRSKPGASQVRPFRN